MPFAGRESAPVVRLREYYQDPNTPRANDVLPTAFAAVRNRAGELLLVRRGRQRRLAEFDWALVRSSVEVNGATDIALTFADYLGIANRLAQRYDQLTDETIRFVEEIEQVSGVPVSLLSTRFDARSVIDRRRW